VADGVAVETHHLLLLLKIFYREHFVVESSGQTLDQIQMRDQMFVFGQRIMNADLKS